MRILVTGVTGLVGRALALRLARDGHEVLGWVRDPQAARAVLGGAVTLVPSAGGEAALDEVIGRVDAVVNLAGAPVARRWTRAHVRALEDSRVGVTDRLVAAMRRAERRPLVLVSASAVGYYGDRGEETLTEDARPGDDFLARLCVRWEDAAREAEALGVRVVLLRIGIVLDGEGGAIAAMRPAFALGLGATLGAGAQRVPFIHRRDLVELVVTALLDRRYVGPVNAVAPTPTTQRELTRSLARALGRPALLRVPAFALRLGLGRAADVVLHGQAAVPRRALALGFRFCFPELDAAVRDVVDGGRSGVTVGLARELPADEYVARRRPRYLLEQRTLIAAPRSEVFDFFRRAENLGPMTPPALAFEILTPTPVEMHEGREIAYRIRLGPAPMRWLTRIGAWDPEERFVDLQLRGPYRAWYHEHRFEARGDATLMIDRVWYAPPLGPLGRVAQVVMVGPMLRRIFGHRRGAIELRFGLAEPTGDAPDSLAA